MVVKQAQHDDAGGKSAVMLCTYYINCHSGTPKQRQTHKMNLDITQLYYFEFEIGFECIDESESIVKYIAC